MTRQEISGKLLVLMQKSTLKKVEWDKVNEKTEISAIGFDSLLILDLIYDAQQAFSLEFDAEELAGVATVGDLITFFEKKLASRN